MKKFNIICGLLGSALLLASCSDDRDHNPVLDLSQMPTTFKLNAPAFSTSAVVLEESSNLDFTWVQPAYGYAAAATYQLQLSLDDTYNDEVLDEAGEVVTPATYTTLDGKFTNTSASYTAKAINTAINKVGAWESEDDMPTGAIKVYVRALSTLEGKTTYSNSINFLALPYYVDASETPLLYLVGTPQGWNSGDMSCLLYPIDNKTFTYTTLWEESGGYCGLKFWEQADFGDWDKAWGTLTNDDASEDGELKKSDDSGQAGAICVPTLNEVYTITFDLKAMTYTWTKLEGDHERLQQVGLVGSFNSWGGDESAPTDVYLTEVTPHNWYCKEFTLTEEAEVKFRANSSWGTNWGFGGEVGDMTVPTMWYGIGVNGAANLKVEAGTYEVFLNDITGDMVFVAK